ncbi:EF-hand domain-containing protein [Tritonibacter horizontis]|uniref:Transaldolase/EF-hand domain-containing protein n=1 Tax=Tritonibacter horizontis TaxID=1768241 RepID=A0A132BYR6_9RHOB|nr:EF-hand domain-containing protein [Tritonibacter horizontis]KUP93182.1 transaldolase/EF-hand domain-containing protein [Tritonibacter horizontis]
MLQIFQSGGVPAAPRAVLLLALSLACAGPAVQAQPSFLQSLDFDGDGAVTVAEATATQNLQFSRLDLDGNGRLSPEEFDAHLQATRARFAEVGQSYRPDNPRPGRIDAFTFSDADADGGISPLEYHAAAARFARSLDRDGDGVIRADEVSHSFQASPPRLTGR